MMFVVIPVAIIVMVVVAIRIRFTKPAIIPLHVRILITLVLWHVQVRLAFKIFLIGPIDVNRHAW